MHVALVDLSKTKIIENRIERKTNIDVEPTTSTSIIKKRKKEIKVDLRRILLDPYQIESLKIKKERKSKSKKEKKGKEIKEKSKENNFYYGYCREEYERKVVRKELFRVPCFLTNGKKKIYGELLGEVKIDINNLAVYYIPRYFYLKDNERRKVSGIVFRSDKETINMSDKVNRQILKRAVYSFTSEFSKSLADAYKDYVLNNKKVSVINGTVIEEQKIDKDYPLIYALLQGSSAFINTITSFLDKEEEKMPYVFIVKPKTLYVEINFENQKGE